jgi:hypothetical protein
MAIAEPFRRRGTELGLQATLADVPCTKFTIDEGVSPMWDYQTVKLLHRHANDDWVPMTESEHDPAGRDPERAWLHGARLFRCTSCDEEIVITAPAETPPGDAHT